MHIYLNKNMRIESQDGISFSPAILIKNEKTGIERWKNLGYYASLEGALEKIIQYKFFTLDINIQLGNFGATFKSFKEQFIKEISIMVKDKKDSASELDE